MMMVEVNSIDSVPGEAELLAYAANYMAARLFTARQRKSLSVLIDVTKEPVRVPVTRAMLGLQKSGLGTRPPTLFEMTVSTGFGIRDAAETIAHEMLHISQAVNGRLLIAVKKTKVAGRKTMVDTARWMGGKPVVIDNLAWHMRPWEIEACHWQELLVDEFLGMSTGQITDQPVQSPKRRQLALYPVSIASPAFVPSQPEPAFDDVVASGDASGASPPSNGPVDTNEASIDRVINGTMADDSGQDEADEALPRHAMPEATMPENTMPAWAQPEHAQPEHAQPEHAQPEEEQPEEEQQAPVQSALNQADLADPAVTDPVSPASPLDAPLNASLNAPLDAPLNTLSDRDIQLPEDGGEDSGEDRAPLAAMPDRPVYPRAVYPQHLYPRPVIEVTVPGLDAPRALERDSVIKKLGEFRQRGLAAAEEAE